MTPLEIITQVRYLCRTDANDNVGAESDLLRMLNDYYFRMATALIDLNDAKFGAKATTDLNINPNQETYALPSDLVKLKRVEVTYDGSTWRHVDLMDDDEIQDHAMDAATINDRFTTSDPKATFFDDMLYLRPIPTANISGGLRIWYIRRPLLLSNATSTLCVPADYHGYLAYGVASEVALRQGDAEAHASMLARWEDGLAKIRKTFAPRAYGMPVDMKERTTNYS